MSWNNKTFNQWWRMLVTVGKRAGWPVGSLGDKESYRDMYDDELSPGDAFAEMSTADI